jgi:hypothetical protein
VEQTDTDTTTIVAMSPRQYVRIGLLGALVGGVTWGLTALLDAYVLRLIVCQGGCASSLSYASVIGNVIAAIIGLVGLTKLAVFRSLLVVLAASFSLWGLMTVMQTVPWQTALAASILLYAAAYGLMAWVSRIRMFALVIIVMLVIIVAARLTLVA